MSPDMLSLDKVYEDAERICEIYELEEPMIDRETYLRAGAMCATGFLFSAIYENCIPSHYAMQIEGIAKFLGLRSDGLTNFLLGEEK